jgi:hypothetical protein
MQIEQIAQAALGHLFGRLARRAAIALVLVICVIVALYHFTVAGLLALDAQVGVLYARLIVAGIYTAASLIAVAALWQQSRKLRLTNGQAKTLTSPREMQLIMLVEAVMLGYELARKGVRSR